MESRHAIFVAYWDHEPTPNPSQEGNFHLADDCLLSSWEGMKTESNEPTTQPVLSLWTRLVHIQ